ncbi:hypothetical protein AWB79_01776 [Caballeronia hypogeia]|uniref:Alpha/beta hydrolase n=1 Tax=Caballeronia hypogeia TaxID=1777140 RepID=A0A158A1X9_9BURK|nr:alpha/beta hydrolase [Caballeronia hypogeia]SAK51719.1 hypothetical protein AWB79_01776 [Caballeronia hypogeia]
METVLRRGKIMQATTYVKSDGVSIAYRISGETGPTLLHIPGAISNLALEQTIPNRVRYIEQMSRFCRPARFDKRGTGLSDRSASPPTFAQQVPNDWRSWGFRKAPPWRSFTRWSFRSA